MRRGQERIFLSYARPDEAIVEQLYQRLREAGFQPWMDRRDIAPGEDWKSSIERAIRHCDVFLAIVSSNSVGRSGVLQGELREALDIWEERLDREGFVIPVRLENCDVPERLQHLQWIDLFEPGGEERLTTAIRERTGRAHRRLMKRIAVFAICGIVAASALFAAWWFGRAQTAHAEFAAYRPGGSKAGSEDGPPMIGVTLWRAVNRVPPPGAGGPCADVEFVRERADAVLTPGTELRLGVEASRRGYIYILNSEGKSGYQVVFPAEGTVPVEPGRLVQIPPPDPEVCRTIRVEQTGGNPESLVVVFSERPLPNITRGSGGLPDGSWPKNAEGSSDWVGRARSIAEEEAAAGTARALVVHERTPQTVFRYEPGSRLPLLAKITLQVSEP